MAEKNWDAVVKRAFEIAKADPAVAANADGSITAQQHDMVRIIKQAQSELDAASSSSD